MRCALVVSLIMLFGVVPVAAQPSVSLEEVRQTYRNLEGLRASFTQVVGSDFAGDSTRIRGTVVLSGDRYRVETPGQIVVTDGSTTWIYSPADSQVVVNDAESEEGPITPETFLAASADQYEVTGRRAVRRSGEPHTQLRLRAASEQSRFAEARLWVRQRDRIVTRLRATDPDGATFDLRLRDITLSPSLEDSLFTFVAPDDVRVVDLRSRE